MGIFINILRTLYPLLIKHGKPEYIRSDNGKGFIAIALQEWLMQLDIKFVQIYPGSAWKNGYNERFNGKFRQECMNAHSSMTLDDAHSKIEDWREDYNNVRPHSAVGKKHRYRY